MTYATSFWSNNNQIFIPSSRPCDSKGPDGFWSTTRCEGRRFQLTEAQLGLDEFHTNGMRKRP